MTAGTLPASGSHLLLVDDDRLVLAVMASSLTDVGFRVTTAESAEEAEAWLAGGERPDLAVLDVRMPGRNGLHLAQRLREFDHIPFMMLSAYSDPQTVQEATLHGALGYAVKPQDVTQLVPAIEAALARANELQDLRRTRQQLQKALDIERNISVATGIVMVQYHLRRADAFALLRDTARKQRRKLTDLADDVVRARETLSLDSHQSSLEASAPVANPLDSPMPVR